MNPLRAPDKQRVDADRHTVSELFHRLNKVLPDNQQVITVSPETKVSEAVELMLKSGFSQLPVVEGDEILGVFSYRSFCGKLSRTKNLKAEPGELHVDEFIEQLEFARVTDEFRSVFDHLNRNDAVLVGEPNRLQGIVTAMDILQYLYRVAGPFVLLEETELALRELIRRAVDDETLVKCAKTSLSALYKPERLPTTLEEMSFNDYVQLVCTRDNWQLFESVFGGTRDRTRDKLEQICNLRNAIFHFKGELTWEDHENLSSQRDWILLKVRVGDAKQRGQGHE